VPLIKYPNEFAPKEIKATKEYGQDFFSALWQSFGGWKAYSEKRARFLDLRRWRSGGQTIEDMKDILGAEDTSWLNLDWEPTRVIANKSDTVVSYLDNIPFKVLFEGADILSITEKDNERMRLYAKAMIKPMREQLEQASGLKLAQPNEFDPEDAEDVDLYMQGEHKLSVEIGMEAAVNYFMKLNGFKDIKRQLIEDFWTLGIGAVYNYYDGETIKSTYVNAPDLIVPLTKTPDFKNAKYAAHIEWKKLGDIYKEAGDSLTLEQYTTIASIAYNYSITGQWNVYIGNGQYYGSSVYNNEWNNLDVPVMVGEFRSANIVSYNIKTNRYGRKSVDTDMQPGPNAKVERVDKEWETVYCGKYIPDANIMYNYAEKKNMPRNKIGNKYDLTGILGYVIFQNNNFDNFNVSPVMRMRPFAKKIQLLELQMQHLIAKSTPGGYSLNIDALAETMKKIKGVSQPMDIYKMFIQYGVLFYSGTKTDGTYAPPPIEHVQGIDFAQLKGMTDAYLFWMAEMERSVGGTAVGMGSAPEERTAVGVQQLAQQAADNALGYIKYGIESIFVRTATMMSRYVQMMHRDKKFDFYSLAYSKENITAIKDMGNLEVRDYNIFVHYQMNIDEQQAFNQTLIEAVAKGTLTADQAMWLREMARENIKLAMIYARRERKKAEKAQAANAQATIQGQQESAAFSEEQKRITQEEEFSNKLQADTALLTLQHKFKKEEHDWEMERMREEMRLKNQGAVEVAEIKKPIPAAPAAS
jgi:hypothetical protein